MTDHLPIPRSTAATGGTGAAPPWRTLVLLLAFLLTTAACGDGRADEIGESGRLDLPAPEAISPGSDLAAMIGATATADTFTLETLDRLWEEQQYREVLPLLVQYRASTAYGKNEVVDYMIGTSACRVPGQEELGRRVLQWVLSHYNLNPEGRRMVGEELGLCPPATRAIPVSLTLIGAGPASTSGTRGKMFYVSADRDKPVGNEPVAVKRVIPPSELEARLFAPGDSRAARIIPALAGPEYRAALQGGFVVASRTHTETQMRQIAQGLDQYLEFFVRTYGMPRPPHLISVYLTPDAAELRDLADRVHGIGIAPASIGYSFRDDLSMAGIIPGQIYGTLAHELFHLMVRRDFGDVPPWLDEGMAALYEVSRLSEGGEIRGVPNWRGPVLQELWSERPPLSELLSASWEQFEAANEMQMGRQAANHATARYLVLYLQDKGILPEVYRALRDRTPLANEDAPDPVRVLESTTGMAIEELERDFVEWFRSLDHSGV